MLAVLCAYCGFEGFVLGVFEDYCRYFWVLVSGKDIAGRVLLLPRQLLPSTAQNGNHKKLHKTNRSQHPPLIQNNPIIPNNNLRLEIINLTQRHLRVFIYLLS